MEEAELSLFNEFMEQCSIMNKTKLPDGEGGFVVSWSDGASFMAAIVEDSSMQARTAEKLGVTSMYTITTDKNVGLKYHDVFKRSSDNKVFRVTSDSDDKHTPSMSSFQFEQVSAEEWELQ